MKPTHTTNKLGIVKVNILHFLQNNGRSRVLDMEMAMCRGSLRAAVASLIGQGYASRVKDTAFEGAAITNAGRTAIGLEVPAEAPTRPVRICAASSGGTYNPATDSHMGRVGLARIGVAGRVMEGVGA